MNLIKKYLPLILLICISFLTFYRLLRPGYFSMQDDMQIFRLEQFDKCVHDFQIPCRYVPDAGLGYGYPLFNFYSPLPYAIAEVFHLVGFSLINSIKLLFLLTHILGVLGMYFFAKRFWGKIGGFISAILFLFAPYQAVDSFVRGAVAEFLALNLLPFLFWSVTELITKNKHKVTFIFLLSALLLSHNLTTITFAPILLIYSLIILWQNKKLNLKNILNLIFPSLIAFGISAFFTVPLIFEKNLITVDTMTQGYFYYIIHFVTLSQLFISRFWGFGASLWGPKDDMSFQIGYVHWILALVLLIYFIFTQFKNKKVNSVVFIFFFLVFLFSAFLTHNKSTPIWQSLPFMPYYQFPWRFLASIILSLSFLGGSAIYIFKNKKIKYLITTLICFTAIILNFNYFKEDIWYPKITDQDKLSGEELTRQSGAGLKDYWPKYGMDFPVKMAPEKPFSSQPIEVISYQKYSNHVNVSISNEQSVSITMPVVYFPKWELYVDQKPTNYQITPDLGLVKFELPAGNHQIKLTFKNTPIRSIANLISLVSLILTIILIKSKKFNE